MGKRGYIRVPNTARCPKCKKIYDTPTLRERKDYKPGLCPRCGTPLRSVYDKR